MQHRSHRIPKDWPVVSLPAEIARVAPWFRLEIGSFTDWGTKLGQLWDHADAGARMTAKDPPAADF
jgi:hypothetical protein